MVRRFTSLIFVLSLYAACISAQGSAGVIVLSKQNACAGDSVSFQIIDPPILSGGDILHISLTSSRYGGVQDSLPVSRLDGRNWFIMPYTFVEGAAVATLHIDGVATNYIAQTALQVHNPLLFNISDTSFTYAGKFGSKVFFKSIHKSSWPTARAISTEQGLRLAQIDGERLNEILKLKADSAGTWLGITDRKRRFYFTTESDFPIRYAPWDVNEPNNAGGQELYVALKGNGFWNDQYTQTQLSWFAETDVANHDSVRTVPGGVLHLISQHIAGSATNWYGPNGSFWQGDTVRVVRHSFYPDDGDRFFSIVSIDGCASQNLARKVKFEPSGPDTALFKFGGVSGRYAYFLSRYSVTNLQAQADAYRLGGYLADVADTAENGFIQRIGTPSDRWIGMTDQGHEGIYTWLHNDTLSRFYNWAPGEPNNHLRQENYVHMRANGKWNDIFPELYLPFVLKIPRSILPGDATTLTLCSQTVDTVQVQEFVNHQPATKYAAYISDAAGSFDNETLLPSFTLPEGKVRFWLPQNLGLGSRYRLRISDSITTLTGPASKYRLEYSDGTFLKPLLATAGDSVYTNSAYPGSFQWYFNGDSLAGATNPTLRVPFAGMYALKQRYNGCQAISDALYVSGATSVKKQTLVPHVYPNPATNTVYLPTQSLLSNVMLLGIDGKIYPCVIEGNILKLNGIPRGVYTISYQSINGQVQEKLIVLPH